MLTTLVVLEESEDDLQKMLHLIHDWCKKWRMVAHNVKSKVMHFSSTSNKLSTFKFALVPDHLQNTNKDKYLEIILHEHIYEHEHQDVEH